MSEESSLSPNKLALLKIRELKRQLADCQNRETAEYEPIAIVSMACRFPRHSRTPEAFWKSLIERTDEVGEIPEDRWDLEAFFDDDPEVPGKMYARHGVFLDQIDSMDPEFFGISPREATWVDPQQRLLMEVSWEALERAGWPADRIGEETGVFVGWMHNDYQNESSDSFLNLNPYIATGAAGSFLCGRLAYYLGLHGPSLAVDTACSSSLVALHLACQSLQRRDCHRAIVGGVNVICSPTTNILTCKLKALSPKGHSRAFDADADGYLRGEGCGVVALRRLSDAERDGDPIIGVIRGSAIGHNGSGSGLTVPNPKAQEEVIRQSLQRAKLSAADVSYLEAHGTGTELGDPIEVQAAAAALAQDRPESNPLLMGSVKTNIGHLEAAAGMAGLIKVLLAMEHEQIPGQLNFETPNPHIAWEKTPVKVLTEATDWPDASRRVAGVSAFGMSGTNAHVIVEAQQKPAATKTPESTSEPQLIVLSGKSGEAVGSLADQLQSHVAMDASIATADLAYTTGVCRTHLDQRAAVVVGSREQTISALKLIAGGGQSENAFHGNARRKPRVAWQFTGQGAQLVSMGKGLYESHAVFREAIDACDTQLHEARGESLREVLLDETRIHHTHWTQPAIFAIQMGLAKLLQSYGLEPDVVLGHSVGQYAAACVAGALSWEEGLHLIGHRGRLIGELPPGGKMLAVFAPPAAVEPHLEGQSEVALAAYNGTHVVVSGPEAPVLALQKTFEGQGLRCKPLTTSHAFHSVLMDPACDAFAKIAGQVDCQPSRIPLVCNMTGKVLAADEKPDGDYWARHIRQPVRFAESIDAVQEMGCDVLLELGPQGVLTRMAAANWRKAAEGLITCLDRDVDDAEALLRAIGRLYVQGVTPDFEALRGNQRGRRLILPTYPFQRRRFWGPDKPRAFHAEFHTAHPLLGGKMELAGMKGEVRYESFVETDSPPWLPDHEVMGQIVLPGAAYLEMALAVSDSHCVERVAFEQPLRPTSRTALQTIVRDQEEGKRSIETHSSPAGASQWTKHFQGILAAVPERPGNVDRSEIESRCEWKADPQDFYQKMEDIGLRYGPQFQTIQSLRYSDEDVLVRLRVDGDVRGFKIPPPLLDGALHCLAVGLLKEDDGNLFLPVGAGRVSCYQTIEGEVWCAARWLEREGKTRTADVVLFDDDGQVVAEISGLQVQQIDRESLRRMSGAGAERLLYEIKWQPFRLPAMDTAAKNWIAVGSSAGELGDSVISQLQERGHSVTLVRFDESASGLRSESGTITLNSTDAEQWEALFTGEDGLRPDGIVWMLDGSEDTRANCEGMLHLSRALGKAGVRGLQCGLQLVTRGGVDVGDGAACSANQTQYWGLGRVLGGEQPELRCRLIDVAVGEQASDDAVVDILQTETKDNQIAIRGGQLLVPRMKSVKRPKGKTSFAAREDCSYLITGGLGMLGRQAAKWLAGHGAKQVVLVSRRSPDEATEAFLEEIRDSGCETIVHSADMGSRDQVSELFQRFGNDLAPLGGVIHTAGLLDDALIEDQTWERFEKVLAPKAGGATLLDEFTRDLSLDFFVLYSSAASVLGSPGQSNYATANAFLDGLAHQRRSQGLPAASLNWGPWSEGMADDERVLRRMALQGITPLSVDEAHQAMELMLTSDIAQATVLDVDWRKMRIGMGGESPAMLEGLTPSRQKSQAGDSQLVAKLKRTRGAERRQLLVTTLQESLGRILSTPEAPDTDRPLIEMGLDSLMAVEFSTELQQMLGESFAVGPTMLFDHPSIDAITDHVLEMIGDQTVDESKEASTAASAPTEISDAIEKEPIAIIGMSCRFPGADNIDEFWDNLLQGVDSVGEIPEDRWDIDRFYSADREPGKMYTREGGFLDGIADFDASFFNIADNEACWIDPQHRMLLENSYHALEHAGVPTQPLADSNVGVFMGIMGQDYAFLPSLDDHDVIRGFQGAGLSHSAGVGRISFIFGFEGPSVAVDTASSSSLVALHQAVRSLQSGSCNLALAGGVNAILAPVNSLLMSKAGLLAPDGRCKSFSAAADGFGRGEGCGVVVLKRLSDAQRDGDKIFAVVRGGAVVHNGTSSSITAPSSKSQARAIDEALRDAKIAPSQVQYLEAHGTGTEFGDPMELGAAASVYGKGRRRDNPLLVGSVKANISHLEAAGGVSGLIKTVLAIHHGVIPQQIHFDEPSAHIPWRRMPLSVVKESTPWPEGEERLAGVTALGLVGTNAHVILSSPPTATADSESGGDTVERSSQLMVLSGRSPTALQTLAGNYARALADESISLGDFCCATGVGRRHYDYRAALTIGTRQEAVEKLHELVDGLPEDRERSKSSPKVAWLFPEADRENAAPAMHDLYGHEPAFREHIDAFDDRLRSQEGLGLSDFSLKAWCMGDRPAEGNAGYDSIAAFAMQMAQSLVWRSWGIEPDVLLGFGVGQFAAAATAGVLCPKDAITLVARRSQILASSDGNGSLASHLDDFESFADAYNYYPPNLPLICPLAGAIVPVHRSLGGSHWKQTFQSPELLGESYTVLNDHDCDVWMQIGGAGINEELAQQLQGSAKPIASVSRIGEEYTMVDALGRLYEAGATPDFRGFYQPWKCGPVDLPLYPFQRKRFWITEIARHLEDNQEPVSTKG